MGDIVKKTIGDFDLVTMQVKLHFGKLTEAQLNWKPAPEKWSIAQCLDHLRVSNRTYYPLLNDIIEGKHKNTWYQNIGFISRWFGNYLIKETGPVVGKPMKNPPAFTPAQSNLPATVVADFEAHQQKFTGKLRQLSGVDLQSTVVSSPALGIITYSLHDLLLILGGHELRHLQQAKNVLQHPQFPG